MKQHIQDISYPAPQADRTGQQVQLCYSPRIVYEVTGWNTTRGLWEAKCIEPSPKLVPMYFREDFLALLAAREDANDETTLE